MLEKGGNYLIATCVHILAVSVAGVSLSVRLQYRSVIRGCYLRERRVIS